MADGFDAQAAKQAGYSDDEILQHLTSSRNFDVAGALKAGYSKSDLITHLSSAPTPNVMGQNQVPTGTITPSPTGAKSFLQNLEGDIRYGGTATPIGKALRVLGAPGVNTGVSEGAADKVASPILGPIRAAQGIADIPDHPVMGALKAASGALQTADIPLSFIGSAPGNAESVMGKVIPSVAKEQAAGKFADVMAAARNEPVNVTSNLSQALDRYGQLVDAGGGRSTAVSKLLNRITSPDAPPLTYREARDFYSNLTRLSADEFGRLTPVMQAQVTKVTQALGESIGQTANSVGKGDQLAEAMKQYKYGAQGEKLADKAIKYGVGAAAGGGIAGAVAKYTYLHGR